MDRQTLQAVQQPLKDAYREDAGRALVTLKAAGALDGEGLTCSVETGRAVVAAGLHPATGETGRSPARVTCSCRRWSRARV